MRHRYLLPAALAALAFAVLPQAALAQDCAYGAYAAAPGAVVALSRPAPGAGPGARYTFLDGRRGFLSDADAPLRCEAGRLRTRGDADAAWAPVPAQATPTRFRSGDVELEGLLL